MAFRFGARSIARLAGVHPDLQRVMKRAIEISDMDFTVLEGRRTIERQRQLLAQGATTTLKSRHLTGHAVDVAPFLDSDGDGDKEVSWHWPHYRALSIVIKQAAKLENVPIEWGGDWRTFKDGPHWQLPWKGYP